MRGTSRWGSEDRFERSDGASELLDAALDGDATDAQRRELRARLSEDPVLEAEAHDLGVIAQRLREAPIAPDLACEILDRAGFVRSASKQSAVWWQLSAAAGLLLAGASAVVLLPPIRDSAAPDTSVADAAEAPASMLPSFGRNAPASRDARRGEGLRLGDTSRYDARHWQPNGAVARSSGGVEPEPLIEGPMPLAAPIPDSAVGQAEPTDGSVSRPPKPSPPKR